MARQTWMGIGVAAVGMALVLGAPRGVAQEQGQEMSSSGMSASSQAENEAEYRLQIAQLRTQVAQLQQQLSQARSSSAVASQGVGGSGGLSMLPPGTTPIDGSNAGAPAGATGIGYGTGGSGSSGTTSASGDSGFALANILHTGQVKSITPRALELVEPGGTTTTLLLAKEIEVLQDGRPVALGRLEEGMRVKTSAPLVAPGNPVTRIEILPKR